MDRDYDIFEKMPDGATIWRDFVHGLENARAKLELLASRSRNEFFAFHAGSNVIVARVNTPNRNTSAND